MVIPLKEGLRQPFLPTFYIFFLNAREGIPAKEGLRELFKDAQLLLNE